MMEIEIGAEMVSVLAVWRPGGVTRLECARGRVAADGLPAAADKQAACRHDGRPAGAPRRSHFTSAYPK